MGGIHGHFEHEVALAVVPANKQGIRGAAAAEALNDNEPAVQPIVRIGSAGISEVGCGLGRALLVLGEGEILEEFAGRRDPIANFGRRARPDEIREVRADAIDDAGKAQSSARS